MAAPTPPPPVVPPPGCAPPRSPPDANPASPTRDAPITSSPRASNQMAAPLPAVEPAPGRAPSTSPPAAKPGSPTRGALLASSQSRASPTSPGRSASPSARRLPGRLDELGANRPSELREATTEVQPIFSSVLPRQMKWLPKGMDPSSTCRVLVKVPAYVELPVEDYHVTENLRFVMDKDTTNWMDLLADLKSKIKKRTTKKAPVDASNQLEDGSSQVIHIEGASTSMVAVASNEVDASSTSIVPPSCITVPTCSSNVVVRKKLGGKISVDKEKIVIFDTGRGMDGSDGNSISKWEQWALLTTEHFGIKPFFGLFGYGGTIASMHLGRMAIVSSKTKESRKVFTLHLSREALLEKRSSVNSKTSWKTAGSVRDPTEEEILLSPHQSFTQVEISGLKRHLEQDKLHGFLKDIYFPYIQYDEDNKSMNTRNPVEFEVNGLNLAEIQEGEVTVTNLHSSNGPDFILQLKISQTTSASCQAHARLKCVYFPIIKGKESINVILEKLRNDGYETKEDFDNFSRVSVRRLGRLLPDARWGPLPFMEPKYRKGQKAEFFKRCCKRVKCFVETDAGFYPTLSKNDLAQHNPFTKALRCLGSSYIDNSSAGEVHVDVCDKNGKLLSNNQLEKQYYDWIKKMHEKYDVEMDGVEVIRAHTSISRKGKTWKRGDRLKILSGAFGQMKSKFCSMKNNFYGTLEYIVVEGLEEDVCGEFASCVLKYLLSDSDEVDVSISNFELSDSQVTFCKISRPMDCAGSQGCILDESE
ncbi:hypothetical protein EJB05_30190, partial [Eragrostis curvula]